MKSKVFAFSALLFIALVSCKKDTVKQYDCTGISPTYNGEIKTILDTHCATSGCHDASSHQNGIDLSTYNNSKSESSNSSFLGSIQHQKRYTPMPKDASMLDDATIQKLYCWVHNGSPQN